MEIYEFDAEIIKHKAINAAFIEFPFDVEKEFGTKGQVKVHVTFDGFEYRGSLANMGYPCHCLGLTQAIRKAIGKQPGDTVHVILKKDDATRNIDIPEDFMKQLVGNSAAYDFFKTLSYTNRKEYVRWITGAKMAETRDKRLNNAISMLLNKVKQP
jgi:hypothetical protein